MQTHPAPTQTPPPQNDPLMTDEQAAQYLGLKNSRTLPAWRLRRQGPVYIKIGRNVRFRRSSLDAFLAAHTVDPAGGAQ